MTREPVTPSVEASVAFCVGAGGEPHAARVINSNTAKRDRTCLLIRVSLSERNKKQPLKGYFYEFYQVYSKNTMIFVTYLIEKVTLDIVTGNSLPADHHFFVFLPRLP
jgi:hypothetical protein